MPTALILKILLSAQAIGLVLTLLARLLPDDKVHACGHALGAAARLFGVARLGQGTFDQVAHFLEHSLGVFFAGLEEGLDEPPAAPPAPPSGPTPVN